LLATYFIELRFWSASRFSGCPWRHDCSDRYPLLSQYDIDSGNTPLLNANYLINPQTSNPIGRTAWREKNTLAWYHTDALGSVLAIAKTNSSITARYDYDVWGNETHNTGTSDNPLGYTGHQMDRLSDDKTGLIYANARYLDPNTSRFLSFDPFEGYDNKPISLHRYLYAYQNPGRYVDKDGEEALQIGAVVGTAFFLSETVAYLSSDPDGNGQSVASEIGTATAQFVDDVKTAAVDYYARQAVALLSAGVMEGEVSPNTALVHDVPQRGRDDHPADTDLNRPRIDTTPIVESLPVRMETPYHDKSPEEYILATPSRAGDTDSGLMLATGKSGSVASGELGVSKRGNSSQYSVSFDTKLSKDMYSGRSDKAHFQQANQNLHQKMKEDPEFANMIETLHPGITTGVQPGARGAYPRRAPTKDVTWHHGVEPGNMQLMLRSHHSAPGAVQETLHPGGVGGMSTWGGER
jgi:RHS repeat-associated protein